MKTKVAAALIIRKGKVLLARRAKGELSGYWEFPGGKMEKGETPQKAIVREIAEELGVEVIAEKVIGVYNYSYPFLELELTLVKCNLLGEGSKLLLDGSHTEAGWKDPHQYPMKFTPLDELIISDLMLNKLV